MNSRKTVAQIQCWRISLWVLVGIGITIVGALLPARVRLFGIFPFLLGGGVGLAGESARGALSGELFSTKRFVLPVLISICVWGGQQGIQYHRYHRAISEAIANDPSAGWSVEDSASGVHEKSVQAQRDFQKEQQRIEAIRARKLSFEGYLLTRVRPLGISGEGSAWGLLLTEALLCGAGSVVGMRFSRNSGSADKNGNDPQ